MKSVALLVTAAAAWSIVVASTVAAAQIEPTTSPRSTNSGVYTNAQAEKGRVLFSDVCIVCHTDPFWRPSWRGKPLGELFTKILKYMPDDNPGTLSRDEVVSALAYILSSNGAPAGPSPLPDDVAALDRIVVDEPLK